MKKTFIQWLKEIGWKSYLIPYLLVIFIGIFMYLSIPDLLESPILILSISILTFFGFLIGITAHMFNAYINSEK